MNDEEPTAKVLKITPLESNGENPLSPPCAPAPDQLTQIKDGEANNNTTNCTQAENFNEKTKTSKRTKRMLMSNLTHLINFYFSDSNIRTSKFLQQKLNDSEMTLQVLMTFTKLKQLTTNENDVSLALRKCSAIEFDGSKISLKKALSEIIEAGVDDKTVYIENVDQKSTIEILKRIFENFGPVNFVSLPKFKNSNRIKGFAFVEFSTSEAAQKSCKAAYMNSQKFYSLYNWLKSETNMKKFDSEEISKFKVSDLPDFNSIPCFSEYSELNSLDVLASRNLDQMTIIPKSLWLNLKSFYKQIQKNCQLSKSSMYFTSPSSESSNNPNYLPIRTNNTITFKFEIIRQTDANWFNEYHLRKLLWDSNLTCVGIDFDAKIVTLDETSAEILEKLNFPKIKFFSTAKTNLEKPNSSYIDSKHGPSTHIRFDDDDELETKKPKMDDEGIVYF